MDSGQQLSFGGFYHIYQRGNGRSSLFQNESQYLEFLDLFREYFFPVVKLFAYCLLPTRIHILVQIKSYQQVQNFIHSQKQIWKQYQSLLCIYQRRRKVSDPDLPGLYDGGYVHSLPGLDRQFLRLLVYIHQTPQLYGITSNFRFWPFSSYFAIYQKDRRSMISKELILNPDYWAAVQELQQSLPITRRIPGGE